GCGTRAPTPSTWPRPAGARLAPCGSCRWGIRSWTSPLQPAPARPRTAGANPVDLAPTGGDEFGPLWELSLVDPELTFTFTASPGAAQTDGHDRCVRSLVRADGGLDPGQVWCRGDRAFVYPVRPADPQPEPAVVFLERLAAAPGFPAGLELPSAGGRSGVGATLLANGRVLFGLYHPTAARVFVAGRFNDWQHP